MTKMPSHGDRLPDSRRRPARGIPRGWALLPVLLGLLAGGLLGAAAADSWGATNSEYQVKAAFLYNFMKFVEWPGDALNSSGTLTLGILGRDPFGDALDEVRGKSAKGRRIVVLHLRGVEELRECDLLFVCASEKGRLAQILKAAQSSHALTVADQEGFCQAGGMINLVFVNNRVGFEVNVAAASRSRLRVSSQLLRLARLVLE